MALTDNLRAYYKLDESSGNAADATVNGYTLTNNNTVGFTTGKINNCANFGNTNTNKWFSITSDLGVTTSSGGSCTMSGWVYPQDFISNDLMKMCGILNNGQRRYSFGISDSSGTKGIGLVAVGSGASVHTTNYAFTANNWYYISATISGDSLTFFVNGSSVGSHTITAAGSTSDADGFGIGRDTKDAGNYWKGYIDELGVWSRALSEAEISSLYNSGSGLPYPLTTGTSKFFQLF